MTLLFPVKFLFCVGVFFGGGDLVPTGAVTLAKHWVPMHSEHFPCMEQLEGDVCLTTVWVVTHVRNHSHYPTGEVWSFHMNHLNRCLAQSVNLDTKLGKLLKIEHKIIDRVNKV